MAAKSKCPHVTNETNPVKQPEKKIVKQGDVPGCSLDEALRVARAIADHHAYQPTQPLDVAIALGMRPSGTFRALCGASVAYGLTDGTAYAAQITVLPLARRILDPAANGDDRAARREAFRRPRVLREFLEKYDGNRLPREDIALNVLTGLGVPPDAAMRTLNLILQGANELGFLHDIKGAVYVNLREVNARNGSGDRRIADDVIDIPASNAATIVPEPMGSAEAVVMAANPSSNSQNRRVFITHGKNKAFIDPLKELLLFGELDPIVSVERESVSQPVPDKVMNDMRSCGAAIIHVEDELKLMDADTKVHIVLNPNVLIEIGAAMALFGRRFILLVKHGVQLPSNLQGLYEVRYEGDKLDGETTIRLLKAIKEIKNHPLPAPSN